MEKRLPPIKQFLRVLALTICCVSSVQLNAETDGDKNRVTFDIPASSLANVLNNYALKANVVMYFDPALAKGRSSKGLIGNFTVEEGFATLLKGTGLIAKRDASGHYTITSIAMGKEEGLVLLDLLKVHTSQASAQAIYESPTSNSVVRKEQIERLPPRNTSDVLASVSGLHTSQGRQDPGVSINIRGLQDFGRVNMMIDGARQNFQRSGHGSNGALYLDPQMLSGVDVSKGPSTTTGGAAVIGGIVNFKTLDFEDLVEDGENSGGRVSLSTGTNAYNYSGNVAAATKLSESVAALAAFGAKEIGEFKKGTNGGNADSGSYWHGTSQFTDQSQRSALLKLQWQYQPDQALKFSYIGFKTDFEEGSNTASSTLNQPADAVNELSADTLLVNYLWRPDTNVIDMAGSLYYSKTSDAQFVRDPDEGEADADGAFDVYYETNTVGGSLSNTSLVDLSSIDSVLNFTYGTEFYYDWTLPEADKQSEGEGQDFWFTGPTPEGERWVASTFFQTEFSHPVGLDLLAGLRYDYYSLEGEGRIYQGTIANPPGVRPSSTILFTDFNVARHKGYWSPALNISYEPFDNFQLFSSYSYGVRPPAITESLMWGMHVGNTFPFYPNPSLVEERARSFEFGANFRFKQLLASGDSLNLKTVWFDSRVDNYITAGAIMGPTETEPDPSSLAYVNLDNPVRFYGYELQAEYKTTHYFSEISWTRTITDLGRGGYDPFPLGSIVGYPPSDRGVEDQGSTFYLTSPEYNAAWSNGLQFLDERLVFGLRIRRQNNGGKGGGAYENVVDWQIYDLWANYKPKKWLSLNLAVDNATDENYAELNGLSYWIGPGRTVIATTTVLF